MKTFGDLYGVYIEVVVCVTARSLPPCRHRDVRGVRVTRAVSRVLAARAKQQTRPDTNLFVLRADNTHYDSYIQFKIVIDNIYIDLFIINVSTHFTSFKDYAL